MTHVDRAALKLEAAVNEIKHLHPNKIAELLASKKILGRPGTIGRCPLALHMHNGYGGRFIVGQKKIFRQVNDSIVEIDTPKNLAAFIRNFDKGVYKDLIQVPPRCVTPKAKKRNHGKPPVGGGSNRHARKRGPNRLHLARLADRHAVVR